MSERDVKETTVDERKPVMEIKISLYDNGDIDLVPSEELPGDQNMLLSTISRLKNELLIGQAVKRVFDNFSSLGLFGGNSAQTSAPDEEASDNGSDEGDG